MVGAIGGASGIIGGLGNIGATSGMAAGVAANAGTAAKSNAIPVAPSSAGVTVAISEAAKSALAADIQQASPISSFTASGGGLALGVTGSNAAAANPATVLNGTNPDVTVNLVVQNPAFGATGHSASGLDELDKLITAALLLALLMHQNDQGNA